MNKLDDIICALATPSGSGAIGVIRLSGPGTIHLIQKMFSKPLQDVQSHHLVFGSIIYNEEELDEVLVSVFRDKKGYTGEEGVEISCHGSSFILSKVLEACLHFGARLAEPGEFTQRAFLNGKLDLSQAEAVADLIASNSKASHEIALNQLKGSIADDLTILREELIRFASLIELELDFSEEDVEFADRTELLNLLSEVIQKLKKMSSTFELGNALKEGVPVAIVGPPNSGKSSLLNQLLQEDKAIVSDIAGTTRDAVEDILNINGILFRIVDTAGIRESNDQIEQIGIERSFEKIQKSKIVLCLCDGSKEEEVKDVRNWAMELEGAHPDKSIYFVVNKADLFNTVLEKEIVISAKNGEGIANLKEIICSSIVKQQEDGGGVIISNLRHKSELDKTVESLERAKSLLAQGVASDLAAIDIREALFHLGAITGEISTEDLLTNIFSKFCIGK